MKFKISTLLLLLAFFCQSFTFIDGSAISLQHIRNTNSGKVLFIISSGISCHACYGWLASKLAELQKKVNLKIYVISDAKENVFQRKMKSLDIKRMLLVDLNETYIFDDSDNVFLKKYDAFTSPSILYFNGENEQYLPYKMIFKKDGLNAQVVERVIK